MKKLWQRSEILLAVAFIAVYVVANSLLDEASRGLGMEMALTLPFDIALFCLLLAFVRRNGLNDYYGLRAPAASAKEMLYYVPLIAVCTVNVWFGVAVNKGPLDGAVYFLAMAATGLVEEMLFRGLLFRAMARRNLRSAIVLTSVLFGAGHVVNLVNGSGATVLENACQLCYAVAVGFLFAAVLLRGKSLVVCMIAHATFNALSLFANEPAIERYQIPVSAALCVVAVGAGVYYLRGTGKGIGN